LPLKLVPVGPFVPTKTLPLYFQSPSWLKIIFQVPGECQNCDTILQTSVICDAFVKPERLSKEASLSENLYQVGWKLAESLEDGCLQYAATLNKSLKLSPSLEGIPLLRKKSAHTILESDLLGPHITDLKLSEFLKKCGLVFLKLLGN